LKEKLSKFFISKVVRLLNYYYFIYINTDLIIAKIWSPKQQGCYLHFSNHKDAVLAARELNRTTKMKAFLVEVRVPYFLLRTPL